MNPELQKEFQRVQREFQGTVAPSLKLTPGALARTHARAGLLKQVYPGIPSDSAFRRPAI